MSSHEAPPILCSLYEKNLLKPVSRSPVPVRLKSNGTLSLGGIISVFTESITEEHAWAVIYGCAKTLEEILSDAHIIQEEKLSLISHPSHIFIHVDGKVHPSTFLDQFLGSERSPMVSVDKAIAKLGEVIYQTLDYGLTDDDERQLTPGLENLLELMLSSDSEDPEVEEDHRTVETDDEGIEQDHDEGSGQCAATSSSTSNKLSQNISSLYRVLNLCTNHLSVSKEAEHHFKNVCRALVSEALELSFFIERVTKRDSSHAKEIQELALLDWACLWKETMFQLRQGVKLKKTDYSKTPIEYELTPYEILMDDIRSRRFKLNKVMVNGDLPPKVKKDAHDIILDFIRSRPPLKPASRRVLPPKKLDVTPQELLMKSICSPSAKASLKKTPGPPSPKKPFLDAYSTAGRKNVPQIVTRDETDDIMSSPSQIKEKKSALPKKILHSSLSHMSLTRKNRSSLLPEKSKSSGNLKRLIKPDPQFLKFDPYDEDDDDFLSSPLSPELHPRSPKPDHPTVEGTSLLEPAEISPILPGARPSFYCSPSDATGLRKTSTLTSTPTTAFLTESGTPKLPGSSRRDVDVSIFNNCDLSLAEMIHIRSVHTKAELEDSPVDPRIKSDLENSKLCFVCMKHYFGFFSWTYKCKFCQKCVCSSCMTKIRIPTDDLSKVSVRSIHDSLEKENPATSSSQEREIARSIGEEEPPGRTASELRNSSNRRLSQPLRKTINTDPPSSLPLTPTTTHSDNKVRLRRSNTLKHEPLSKKIDTNGGPLCTVCLNCRDIILNLPGRNSRRQQVTRSLCLG